MIPDSVVVRGRASWLALGWFGRIVAGGSLAGAIVTAGVWMTTTWRAIGVGVVLVVLSWASLVDLTERRLPDDLTGAATLAVVVTTVAVTIAEGFETGGEVALSALAGAAAFTLPLLLLHLASPSGMGFGDVKTGIGLGATIGLIDAWSSFVALFAASALTAVGALVARRRRVPFGPGLVVGTEIALLLAKVRGTSPVG